MSKKGLNQYSGYAGFWRRVGSNFLDLFIVMFILILLTFCFVFVIALFHPVFPPFPIGKLSFVKSFISSLPFKNIFLPFMERINFFFWMFSFELGLVVIVPWLYSSILHSSSLQATYGMQLVNDKITDLKGDRISFWRASARYWLKFVFGLIFVIGLMDNILIAITGRKQAFHDILTGCLIWREK
ncbi:MAG: RDD family protein [Firmicutes bacterium]|nr:RDD family protein [Bacillota bacterium]